MVKFDVAERLRQQIVTGGIAPGSLVVEIKWAKRLGVSQGSVREALNILAGEGFIERVPGRRARVINMTTDDVAHIFQLRGVLEGLAARLVTEAQPNLDKLARCYDQMERAMAADDLHSLIERDLRFHLLLCELSGNPILFDHSKRILVPLFAFSYMRARTSGQGVEPWRNTLSAHGRIIEHIRAGDPFLAEQFVVRSTPGFATVAYDVWGASGQALSQKATPVSLPKREHRSSTRRKGRKA
jgi:DNA-binding GntR family transcriptional regulator